MATLGVEEIAESNTPKAGSARAIWNSVKEYLPTFLTEFAVMASQVVVYKMAAILLGKEGFSEYALARRTVALIFPIPVLGLSVGLPRFIGFSNGRNDVEASSRFYGATLVCVGGAAGLCAILLNVFAGWFGYLFFGDAKYQALALPLSLMIVGLCLHTVVCGYFRGHRMLNRANLLQLINLAIAPIIAFMTFRHSLGAVLSGLGWTWTAMAGLFLLQTPFQSVVQKNWSEVRILLRYGVQRVPGDFFLMALFALPATIVAHWRGVQEAGFIAFGTTVLSMIGAMFMPAGLVLLPRATFMFAEGSQNELREHLKTLVKVTVVASLGVMLIIWIWIPGLIHLYLGDGYERVVPIVRILVLGALPYSLYVLLRIVVDAYHEHGVTGLILLSGLLIFLAYTYAGKYAGMGMNAILGGFLAGVFSLAALSIWECTRILREK